MRKTNKNNQKKRNNQNMGEDNGVGEHKGCYRIADSGLCYLRRTMSRFEKKEKGYFAGRK